MMKKLKNIFNIFCLFFLPALLSVSSVVAQTQLVLTNNVLTKDDPGSYYLIVTKDSRMSFEVWGGGGRGGSVSGTNQAGGGGGGGAYARTVIEVKMGDRIDIVVGAGGNGSVVDGGVSEVKLNDTTIFVKAAGGRGVTNNSTTGGVGGAVGDCVGDQSYKGGNGASSNTSGILTHYGGGGGSSAGMAAQGANGSGNTGGPAPSNGGKGGDGYSGLWLTSGNGSSGTTPGGGGGGAMRWALSSGSQSGGNGGSGRVRITNMCRAFWLKADMPGVLPADGGSLNTWQDRTDNHHDGKSFTTPRNGYTASTSIPTWHDNKINFNPAVKFTDGYFLTHRCAVYNDIAIYTVFSTEQTKTSTNWYTMPAIIGGEAAGATNDWGFSQSGGRLFFKSTNDDTLINNPYTPASPTSPLYNTGKPFIASGFRKLNSESSIYVNGVKKAFVANSGDVALNQVDSIGIGRNPTETGSQFEGYIAEVTALVNMCTPTDRDINNTYFAIKYGITLEHDYKRRHATDSVLYSIASHAYDIAGLGRQDFTLELHQKISTSNNVPPGNLGRVIIATNNDFVSSNVTQTSRIGLADGQYLIWGHNNEPEGWTAINSKIQRQERVWKIQNTANSDGVFVSDVFLQVDLNQLQNPIVPMSNPYEMYTIIVSNSADFSGSIAYYPLTNTSGSLYSTEMGINFPGGVHYFTLAKMTENYWTGSSNTTWLNTDNWGAGFTPGSNDDVIFATVANYGTAATNNIVITEDENIEVRNIINESDKNIVIEAGASLKLNGYIQIADNTNPERLQIKAAAGKPNGSFIVDCDAQNSLAQPDIYATVQMYAKSKKYANSQTWTDNIPGSPTETQPFTVDYSWQFFGVPVASVRAEPTFYAAAVRQYFEDWNGDNNTQYYQKWKNIYNEDYLTAFKGYEITQESPKIYTIQGKLVYCDQHLTMTRKAPYVGDSGAGNAHYGLGHNIFGNSFTASVNVANIGFPEEAEKTVYLYNTGSFVDWGNAGATNSGTQSAGQYTAIPQETAAGIYDGKIPSMNGFLVKFLPIETTFNADDKTLTLPYSSVSANSQAQTAPRQKLSWLEVVLEGKNATDRLWLYSQPGTTAGFDNGWDGFKFFGTPHSFIFTETQAGPMQVDADTSIEGKIINFYAAEKGDYTLHLVRNNLQAYEDLQLVDLESRRIISLDRDTVSYAFAGSNKGKITRRFLLRSAAGSPINWDSKELIFMQFDRNLLTVNNYTSSAARVSVFDSSGRVLLQNNYRSPIFTMELNLQAGMYILQIEAGNERFSEKFILR